jgi:hypothetical protein
MSDQSSGRETTIVDNEVFNVLSSLVNKLQALAAYDKYEQDGGQSASVWQELRRQAKAPAALSGHLGHPTSPCRPVVRMGSCSVWNDVTACRHLRPTAHCPQSPRVAV